MKSKMVGRIKCGRCERLLHDLYLRRRPRTQETAGYLEARKSGNATLAALDHVEQHSMTKPMGATGYRRVDDDGVTWLVLQCKCGNHYAVDEYGDLHRRVKAARDRGEDVILTDVDTTGHAKRHPE